MLLGGMDKGRDGKSVLGLSSLFALIGGLCCLTPIVMILLGLATVSAANSWGNILYGEYRWYFRAAAIACFIAALVIYLRKQGVCTLDEARRQRNRIVNLSVLALILGVGFYIFWTYTVLHYWGIAVGLPWAVYDESWAVPAALAVFGAGALIYWIQRRRARPRNTGRLRDVRSEVAQHR